MRSLVQQSRISQLMAQRNSYLVLTLGLVLLCILLISLDFYLCKHERIIVVPPIVEHNFWISNSEVSSEYLSQMSMFLAYLRLNVTPDNISSQQQQLLRYIAPEVYGNLKNELIFEKERIINQQITTAFYPIEITIDIKKLIATVKGDLTTNVGNAKLTTQRVNYKILFSYNYGRLLIKGFQEIK